MRNQEVTIKKSLFNFYLNRDYFPQNIMHDRRVMRGSTYAAMVIPAGTNPDSMVMDKNFTKKRTFKKSGVSTKKSNLTFLSRNRNMKKIFK